MLKKKIIALLIVALLVIADNTSSFAAKIVSGSSCKGINAREVSSGKLFTCVKIGEKLKWNKGVVLAQIQLKITGINKSENEIVDYEFSATLGDTCTAKFYQPNSPLLENTFSLEKASSIVSKFQLKATSGDIWILVQCTYSGNKTVRTSIPTLPIITNFNATANKNSFDFQFDRISSSSIIDRYEVGISYLSNEGAAQNIRSNYSKIELFKNIYSEITFNVSSVDPPSIIISSLLLILALHFLLQGINYRKNIYLSPNDFLICQKIYYYIRALYFL